MLAASLRRRTLSSALTVARGRTPATAVVIASSSSARSVRHSSTASAASGPAEVGQQPQPMSTDGAAGGGPGHLPASKFKPMVAELEKLQASPWAFAYRLTGMFSDEQWQNAAAGDMYMSVLYQAHATHAVVVERASTPDRYYTRLQIRGLHCWLVHGRLREEPIERHRTLMYNMMEHVWEQTGLDLTRDMGFGYIESSKHLKAAQLAWHGLCKSLDDALSAVHEGNDEGVREAMSAVLLRNVYVDEEGEPLVEEETGETLREAKEGSLWLAQYLLEQRAHLMSLPAEDVLLGRVTWAEPPADSK